MIKDAYDDVAEKARAKIAEIEHQATRDLPNGEAYLAQCSEEGRESVMSALVDEPTLRLWRALKIVARAGLLPRR